MNNLTAYVHTKVTLKRIFRNWTDLWRGKIVHIFFPAGAIYYYRLIVLQLFYVNTVTIKQPKYVLKLHLVKYYTEHEEFVSWIYNNGFTKYC